MAGRMVVHLLVVVLLAFLYQAEARGKFLDLSWTFDNTTQYFPLYRKAKLTWRSREITNAYSDKYKLWAFYNSFGETAEHGGTHMDAPVHCLDQSKHPEAWYLHEIPVDNMIGPGMVIDVSAKAANNRDYQVTVEDILEWERKNGPIPKRAIVLVHSGWDAHYYNTTAFLGTSDPNGQLHYPGLNIKACNLLVERQIIGVGVDTAAPDPGTSLTLPCLPALFKKNIWVIEMVKNAGKLPPKGYQLFALPIKIGHGSGGPVRLIAVFPPPGGPRALAATVVTCIPLLLIAHAGALFL